MEYAISPVTGREYLARTVAYQDVRRLKLLCPVCGGKVFKRVRYLPSEAHFFCHHAGGAPDCELYRPGSGAAKMSASSVGEAQGQEFRRFAKSVAADIRTLLVASQSIAAPFDCDLLDELRVHLDTFVFDAERESVARVEGLAAAYLVAAELQIDTGIQSRVRTLCGFYQNEQARFIDCELGVWLAYAVAKERQQEDLERVTSAVVEDADEFDAFAALTLTGLALLYAQQQLEVLRPYFERCFQAPVARLVRRNKRERRVRPSVPKTEALPMSPEHGATDSKIPSETASKASASLQGAPAFEYDRSTNTLTHLASGRRYEAHELERVYGVVPGWKIRGDRDRIWAADMYSQFVK